jgi:hypothetical protein
MAGESPSSTVRVTWIVLTAGVIFIGKNFLLAIEPKDAPGYVPLGSRAAVQAALRTHLKIVRDWLGEKDYLSVAEAGQGLTALAWLYGLQSNEPAWQAKAKTLQEACAQLSASAKAKDLEGCENRAKTCEKLLNELAGRRIDTPTKIQQSFKPFGATKTWMLLMDGAYVDAKTAKSAPELDQLASVIAEEANVVAHQRTDESWRKAALAVRASAQAVADLAKKNDVAAARASFKTVYQRCEACHEAFRR